MEKVLVTGGSGFVGAHVVRALLGASREVHLLVRASSDLSALGDILPRVAVHTGDLREKNAISDIVKKIAPQHVFHLATSTLMSGKTADAGTLLSANVEGAINLMDAAREIGVSSFINIGSFAEYGPKDHPVAEDERCDPVELYAVTKLAATLYGQGLARRYNFPCVTFRLFTPYGPGIQKGRLVRNVIEKVRAGEPIPLTKPTIARDFIYAGDIPQLLIEASESAAKHAGKIFNLGSGESTTLGALVSLIENALAAEAKPEWGAVASQSYDSELWQADMQSTFSAFSWRPTVGMEEGLSRTIAYLS